MAGMEGWVEDLETLDARRYTLALRKLADSINHGVDRSPFVGSGVEYVQSRPYQWGDSLRSVDWRVTARTGRFFVKEHETPKTMPCYLLIDTSASMAVSSARRSKYAVALHVAGGLALACLDRASAVGVVGVGERVLRVRPSLSRTRVLQWLLELRRHRYDEGTRLAERIGELSPSLAQRSLVIVLSDLHDPGAVPALRRLAHRHDCIVLQLADPAESGLRGGGLMRAREAETGREFLTHGRASWSDPAPAARELKRGGIDHLLLRTDQPFAPRLRELLRARGWFGKGKR